jgi:3-oxoadipate enol-lactonase
MLTKVAHLSDQSVRYLEAGSGRAMVLLHAFPLSADLWLPQVSRVATGWRVIAPDLRGFRGAGPAFDTPLRDDLTVDDYAADILALMTHLDLPEATIGGLSMGGYVAFAMVRAAPSRVSGLLLADTRATADSDEQRSGRDRLRAMVMSEGAGAVAREMIPKLLAEATVREQPDLADTVSAMITLNRAEAIAAALHAIKMRPDSRPLLSSITCPTTIVCGEHDALTPVSDSEAMHGAIAGSRLVILPGAGHLSSLENPMGFNAALSGLG